MPIDYEIVLVEGRQGDIYTAYVSGPPDVCLPKKRHKHGVGSRRLEVD